MVSRYRKVPGGRLRARRDSDHAGAGAHIVKHAYKYKIAGPTPRGQERMTRRCTTDTITTEMPDVMWGTDKTAMLTVFEGADYVFKTIEVLHDREHWSACGKNRQKH